MFDIKKYYRSVFSVVKRLEKSLTGFTLIEVLVGAFLISVIFLGIFGAYRTGLWVVGQSQNRITAINIAEKKIEKIRNLPYSLVGVEGSSPDGILQEIKSEILNNREYTIFTRVDYVIDPTDGLNEGDGDECPFDYKKAEIKVSWEGMFKGAVKMSTNISPKNLAEECEHTGGILFVSVFDAYGAMVFSPLIEIKDVVTEEVIKTAIPDTGEHYFALGPGVYKIFVSKNGYSRERTYGIEEVATPVKPNPLILEGALYEVSFPIDKVSDFSVKTRSLWGVDYFFDSFVNYEKLSGFQQIEISDNKVKLAFVEGVYENSGYIISEEISPDDLIYWDKLIWDDFEPQETEVKYQILYFTGEEWNLIPDEGLPGNSTGFTNSPVDISFLDINEYSQLKIKANLATNDNSTTPEIYEWQLSWITEESAILPDIPFDLRGEKIIGKDSEENELYKYSESHNSGASGAINISNLEWDSYHFIIDPATGLNLEEIVPEEPVSLLPDSSLEVVLYLASQNSLMITVKEEGEGIPVFSAAVRLTRDSIDYDKTQYTDENGKTHFISLEQGTYNIEVDSPGYSNFSGTVSVSEFSNKLINLERVE